MAPIFFSLALSSSYPVLAWRTREKNSWGKNSEADLTRPASPGKLAGRPSAGEHLDGLAARTERGGEDDLCWVQVGMKVEESFGICKKEL